jgi:hypothetical protein
VLPTRLTAPLLEQPVADSLSRNVTAIHTCTVHHSAQQVRPNTANNSTNGTEADSTTLTIAGSSTDVSEQGAEVEDQHIDLINDATQVLSTIVAHIILITSAANESSHQPTTAV